MKTEIFFEYGQGERNWARFTKRFEGAIVLPESFTLFLTKDSGTAPMMSVESSSFNCEGEGLLEYDCRLDSNEFAPSELASPAYHEMLKTDGWEIEYGDKWAWHTAS